jgi:Leucine-rich repeat (LRR) protein
MNEAEEVQHRVRQIIQRARDEQSKSLDLSSRNVRGELDTIPDEVFEILQLEDLNLMNQNIRRVPERIRNLPALKSLFLVGNPIESVPDIRGLALDWAGYLRCRQTLSKQNVEAICIEINAEGSEIHKSESEVRLLRELVNLPRLSKLRISLSSISNGTMLPKPEGEVRDLVNSVGEFHRLENLHFFGLLLENVPAGIRKLKGLRSLTMHAAGLRHIPDWIGELSHLQDLGLGMNALEVLPVSLAMLTELYYISMNQNRFSEIPDVVFRLRNLRGLRIGCDPWRGYTGLIKRVPLEILQLHSSKS